MSSFVALFKSVGFDEAAGGEFTKRAFLNNKIMTINNANFFGFPFFLVDLGGVIYLLNVLPYIFSKINFFSHLF